MLAANDFGTYGAWTPPLISEHGAKVDQLISILHWFMALLFVVWGIFFVYCLIRFRQRTGQKARYEPVKGKISKYGEIAVVIFEAIVLIGFSIPAWAAYKDEPPKEEDRVLIRVIGEQFQWNFHYPGTDGVFGRTDSSLMDTTSNPIGLDESDPNAEDDVWTINEFHLPVGRDIYLRIASKDVIHSFSIPTMRVKQDAIPGMGIPIWFKVHKDATTENLKKQMTETFTVRKVDWYRLRHHVATQDYQDKSGQVILRTGDGIGLTYQDGDKLLARLREAGVGEIEMQPRDPLAVICAQLCGNSHYTMSARIITHEPEAYEQWLIEQTQEEEVDFD